MLPLTLNNCASRRYWLSMIGSLTKWRIATWQFNDFFDFFCLYPLLWQYAYSSRPWCERFRKIATGVPRDHKLLRVRRKYFGFLWSFGSATCTTLRNLVWLYSFYTDCFNRICLVGIWWDLQTYCWAKQDGEAVAGNGLPSKTRTTPFVGTVDFGTGAHDKAKLSQPNRTPGRLYESYENALEPCSSNSWWAGKDRNFWFQQSKCRKHGGIQAKLLYGVSQMPGQTGR